MNGHDSDSRDSESQERPSRNNAGSDDPRVSSRVKAFSRLKKRAEFLAVAKGARVHDSVFTVQAIRRAVDETPPAVMEARFGLTVTKKTGNSVERNRIRRRLREALRLSPDIQRKSLSERAAHDYVIVARRDALSRGFADLARDLARAIERIDKKLDPHGQPARGKNRGGKIAEADLSQRHA